MCPIDDDSYTEIMLWPCDIDNRILLLIEILWLVGSAPIPRHGDYRAHHRETGRFGAGYHKCLCLFEALANIARALCWSKT
jgi:hypothetical protein